MSTSRLSQQAREVRFLDSESPSISPRKSNAKTSFDFATMFRKIWQETFPTAGVRNAERTKDVLYKYVEDSEELISAREGLATADSDEKDTYKIMLETLENKKIMEVKNNPQYQQGYKNLQAFNEAFNNHPFVMFLNTLIANRNLMDGSKPLTAWNIFKNGINSMSGGVESTASEGKKIASKMGAVVRILFFVWSVIKIPFNFVTSLVKLFTEVLTALIYKLGEAGFNASVNKLKEINKRRRDSDKDRYISDHFVRLFLGIAIGVSDIFYFFGRIVHFIGRATTSPLENMRTHWNNKEYPILGKFLAIVSFVATPIIYSLLSVLAFTYVIQPGLTILGSLESIQGTWIASGIDGILTGINWAATNLAIVAAPLGELMAGFFSNLAIVISIDLEYIGLAAMAGAAVAFGGTIVSKVQSLISNAWHREAVAEMIKEDNFYASNPYSTGTRDANASENYVHNAPLIPSKSGPIIPSSHFKSSHFASLSNEQITSAPTAAHSSHNEENASMPPFSPTKKQTSISRGTSQKSFGRIRMYSDSSPPDKQSSHTRSGSLPIIRSNSRF